MSRKDVFPRGGCLIFFGDIFGWRFHENYHQIVGHEYNEVQKIFRINFDEDETCTIYGPVNIVYSEKAFVIKDASRITWKWYYYGREKTIENLNSWDFIRIDSTFISKTTAGNLSTGTEAITIDRSNQFALQFL